MLKKFSNKQKLKWLGVGLLPIALICYKLAISNTLAEYKKFQENQKNLTFSDTSPSNSELLKQKSKQLNSLLQAYSLDTLHNGNDLLEFVADYCNDSHLKLDEYKPIKTSAQDSIQLITRTITVEGEFVNCLQLVYALETQFKAGRVGSVVYKSYLKPNNKTIRLTCTIYIQNII